MKNLFTVTLAALLLLATSAYAQTPPVSFGRSTGAYSGVDIDGKWGIKVYSNRLLDISPREFGRCTADPARPLVYCGTGDGVFRALRKHDGTVVWTLQTSGAVRAAPAVTADAVILASADGCMHSLDPDTGAARWEKPYCIENPIWGTPVVTDELVYFSVLGNQVYAIGTRDGKFRFKVQRDRPQAMSSEGISAPVVAGDVLYSAFSDGVLVASNRFNGREIWHQDLAQDSKGPSDADSTPVVDGDVLYSGAFAAGPVAVKISDGTILWKGKRFGVDRPVVFGKTVIVADADGFVTGLDRATGEEKWVTKLDTPAAWNPVLISDVLIVGGDRGLWMVRADDGKPLALKVLSFGVTAEPGVDGDDLYFAAPGGTVNKATLLH